jgi:hypothetical protein
MKKGGADRVMGIHCRGSAPVPTLDFGQSREDRSHIQR